MRIMAAAGLNGRYPASLAESVTCAKQHRDGGDIRHAQRGDCFLNSRKGTACGIVDAKKQQASCSKHNLRRILLLLALSLKWLRVEGEPLGSQTLCSCMGVRW